jgi:branched-chain amino acid transport system ATP-binding protein
MQALSIIKNEHRNLGAVLFSLEKLAGEIEAGKHPEFKVFHGLLTYLDRFLHQYHHPKEEEYLFPVVRKRCPELSVVLEECSQEHHDGERMLADVLKALSAYEFLGESEAEGFTSALKTYTDFERQHAIQEEEQILSRAREKLLVEDWERIDVAFADNEDPLFSSKARAEFEKLYTTVTALAPKSWFSGE